MALVEETVVGYKCERCAVVVPAESVFDDDKPEGYFLQLERVTEAQRHYRTDGELFFHDKICLIDFFTYGISNGTIPWRPIGRGQLSKRPTRW